MNTETTPALLSVRNLEVVIDAKRGSYSVLDGVSFDVQPGEILGIVGESGCGKSMTMSAVMRLLPSLARVSAGSIEFDGEDILALDRSRLEELRGGKMTMVFQDPMTALDPLYTIGDQILEAIRKHLGLRGAEARELAINYLKLLELTEPEKRMNQYPFELSGGMRQRVIIAIALCCKPALLICDEPTTGLDVTIQAKILDLVRDLHDELGGSVVFISHNMGVIASLCDRVLVMYEGSIVERGPVDDLFYRTAHPYTTGLLGCIPQLEGERAEVLTSIPGSVSDARNRQTGCPFSHRCTRAMNICRRLRPPEFEVDPGHGCACWLYADAARAAAQHKEADNHDEN